MIDYQKALDEGTPPTTDEVRGKQKQARQEEKRIEQKRRKWLRRAATVLGITVGLLLVTAMLIQWMPEWGNAINSIIVRWPDGYINISVIFAIQFVPLYLVYRYDRAITIPLEATRKTLKRLEQLSVGKTPHACVEIDAWREEFPEIDEYLKQVAKLRRHPVLGEYEAAREWAQEARKRKRDVEMKALARAACERF
jgi:ferric-dicitrate binding protein FerR (iron transport regulator)